MTDILGRLYDAIHKESAAIAPQTSHAVEAMKEAAEEIERLRAELADARRDERKKCAEISRSRNRFLGEEIARAIEGQDDD